MAATDHTTGRPNSKVPGAKPAFAAALPSELEISLSNRCSLACSYCYFGNAPAEKPRSLSPEQACLGVDRYIEAAGASGIRIERIGFVDSPDPLLRYKTLKSCVKHIRSRLGGSVVIEVQTNGLLLDAGKVRSLADQGVRSVLRLDGNKAENDRHRVFPGKPGRSSFEAVVRRLKNLPAGYMELLQAAPSFTPATAGALGSSVDFLYGLGFRNIQLKNLNIPEIWTESGLNQLRAGLRELKRFCLPLIAMRARRGKGLRLHLTYLKKEDSYGFCEFVLGCDGRFYPGGYTPKAPAGLDFCAGDIKKGINVPRLSAIRAEILDRLGRHDPGGYLRYIPSPGVLYLGILLRRLDPAEAIRSNGLKSLIIIDELRKLMRVDKMLDSSKHS